MMKKYFKVLLPTPAVFITFFILPIIFIVYFLLSRYTDQFIRSEGIDYVSIQSNILAQLYITGQLADWVMRFMDFAFWGMLASVGLLIFWAISAARVSIHNHSVQKGFMNFKVDARTWSNRLIVVSAIKVILSVTIVYSVLAFIISAIPRLATGIGDIINELNWSSFSTVLYGVLYMVLLQTLFVFCIKMFKHIETS
jgi:hypothetical protein